jgi:hypothetical protein
MSVVDESETPVVIPPDGCDICREMYSSDSGYIVRMAYGAVVVRIEIIDSCDTERHLLLVKRRGEKARLSVIAKIDDVFCENISELLRSNPQLRPEEACRRLEQQALVETIPEDELDSMIADFARIRVDLTEGGDLVFDGNMYEVSVFAGANRWSFFFCGAPGEDEPENPIRAWVDRLLERAGEAPCGR